MRGTFAFVCFSAVTLCAYGQGTLSDYDRANNLGLKLRGLLDRSDLTPQWIEGGKRFWYAVSDHGKLEYFAVDARSGKKDALFGSADLGQTPAPISIKSFDAKKVLFSAGGKQWSYDRSTKQVSELSGVGAKATAGTLKAFLPARPSGSGEETNLEIVNRSQITVVTYWVSGEREAIKYTTIKPGESYSQHTYGGHVWLLRDEKGNDLAAYQATDGSCTAVFDGTIPTPPPAPPTPDLSPDHKWRVIQRENNLFIRPAIEGKLDPLSTDGTAQNSYNGPVAWSPNGKSIAAIQTEAGEEHIVTIVRSSPPNQVQPELIKLDYQKPGDRIPHPRLVLFDVTGKKRVQVDETLFPNPWDLEDIHWSADSKTVYFTYNQRGHQVLRLLAADAATGKVRQVLEDTSPTFIDYSSKRWISYLEKTNQAIWMSETHTGYNHPELVDLATGKRTQITSGPWMVRAVEKVDEDKKELLLRVLGVHPGQDPYHVHYMRASFDGKKQVILTEGDGTHRLAWAPDAETFVDTYSRADLPPVYELRRASDGKLLAKLDQADDTRLKAAGRQNVERFVAKGRDGKTDIYGIIFKPTNFDPNKKYPVIEDIYAGPQDCFVPKSYQAYAGQMRLAELGFIVVKIDGMGTNWRGKAFHDVCFRNLSDGGCPDRILWMKEAAKSRPWMDLDRVGIFGTSAGGQNAASAVLRFGDFYKVAVSDCGCHDNRMDKIWWNEQWMGYPIGPWYAENSNVTAAKNLTGKLFLIVGEVDTNVDPASTMQVANALILANRDFDLLVVPNSNHGALGVPYVYRRMQDYFVRHLLGVEPRK